jgi:peroxiredoxin
MKAMFGILLAGGLLLSPTPSSSSPGDGVEIGDEAPGFKLKNINSEYVSLKDYKDKKGVIVIFTCNHCPFSKAYEERIKALDKSWSVQGYPVVAINPNDVNRVPEDSFNKMQERAKDKGFTFPYLHDESQEIAKAYGASRTPHVFILSSNGSSFTVEYIGAIDNNVENADDVSAKYVEDALRQLSAGETIDKNFTKAIGCTIKWKQ